MEEKEETKEIKKYKLLNKSLGALSSGVVNLLILNGSPGMGKTRTTLDYLKKQKINYEYISTYSTPLSFYKLLYKNRKKTIIVFDDLDSINDSKIISMLKSACWSSDGERILNYHSTSPILDKEGLPESFVLEANIILIFNHNFSGFEPILDRGITLDLNFTFQEKIQILKSFQKKANIEEDVLKYVVENCNEANKNLSIRSLVILSDLKRGGYDFEDFAEEILKVDFEVQDLINMSAEAWCSENYYTKRTYYRKLKTNNLLSPLKQKKKELEKDKIQFE